MTVHCEVNWIIPNPTGSSGLLTAFFFFKGGRLSVVRFPSQIPIFLSTNHYLLDPRKRNVVNNNLYQHMSVCALRWIALILQTKQTPVQSHTKAEHWGFYG